MLRSKQQDNAGQFTGRVFIITLWILLALLVGTLLLEGCLQIRREWKRHYRPKVISEYSKLCRAYYPFTIQHINPFYLFFFPFEAGDRSSINNHICSIDKHGFRGADFLKAEGRELAFLLGGSAAFGHFSSGDNTTITGYLNTIQERYYFVNAGVPSWNSFQELTRLSQQILDFSPALVVAYDGLNDSALATHFWTRGLDYPAGTPESFDELAALVGDIRGERLIKRTRKPVYERFFPLLSKAIKRRIIRKPPVRIEPRYPRSGQVPPDSVMFDAADRYLANLSRMNALTTSGGARFVAIFQPNGGLHKSAPEYMKEAPRIVADKKFRDYIFPRTTLPEHFDYSTLFDLYPHETVWRQQPGHEDIDDEVIFVDGAHLYDRGNRFVAEMMVKDLKLQ